MAEAFLAHALPDASVESAGLGALVGESADPQAVECMASHGLDISRHVARQLSPEMLRQADLVLTATRGHLDDIERSHPWVRGRVFRLGQWIGHDIDDPYRRGDAAFRLACQSIHAAVVAWTPRVNALRSRHSAALAPSNHREA